MHVSFDVFWQVRGTLIGPTKKVRDVFSACLRIDVPQDARNSTVDGHVKLVMCFVEVCYTHIYSRVLSKDADPATVQKVGCLDSCAEMGHGL
jgi:hypothetical protein